MNKTLEQQIEAAVYNFALGDAWGYVTEFKKFDDIKKNQYPMPSVLKVSDDTQMGLYTMKAIKTMSDNGVDFDNLDFRDEIVQDNIRNSFARSYLMFYFDEDNNRAPGMTCMTALEAYHYSSQITGLEGSLNNYSLGCGTIMRTPWIGLLPYSRETLANLAVLHSQTTHGDPAGWVVSAVLTLMINDYIQLTLDTVNDSSLHNIVPAFDSAFKDDNSMFDHALRIIEEIWQMNLDVLVDAEPDFLRITQQLLTYADHWGEIETTLVEVDDDFVDINAVFGEGWIATETFYNALGAVSLYSADSSENVLRGVKRLVYTNGDSDSIAAVGGVLWGVKSAVSATSTGEVLGSLENRYANELFEMTEFVKSHY